MTDNEATRSIAEQFAAMEKRRVELVEYATTLPPRLLQRRALEAGISECLTAAAYPKTKGAVLAHLSRNKSVPVRWFVAAHAKTPASILTELAGDADVYVRARVAASGKTPIRVLKRLAEDPDPRVRLCARGNLKLS